VCSALILQNLDCLSIPAVIHNQYITHDVLESESEIWARSQSRSRNPTIKLGLRIPANTGVILDTRVRFTGRNYECQSALPVNTARRLR